MSGTNYAMVSRKWNAWSAAQTFNRSTSRWAAQIGHRLRQLSQPHHTARDVHERELRAELPKFIAAYETARAADL